MEFSPHCRAWIFALDERLAETQREPLLRSLQSFVDSWAAHKVPVRGMLELLHEKFIVIAADEQAMKVSGCSIDGLFSAVSRAAELVGASLSDSSKVHLRLATGELRTVSRAEFRELAAQGSINESSPVFDTTISNLGSLAQFERPLRDSWHARLLNRA